MNDFLQTKCKELDITTAQLFRIAHLWAFDRDVDMTLSADYYRKTGEIPRYVTEYLTQLKEKEHENDSRNPRIVVRNHS